MPTTVIAEVWLIHEEGRPCPVRKIRNMPLYVLWAAQVPECARQRQEAVLNEINALIGRNGHVCAGSAGTVFRTLQIATLS